MMRILGAAVPLVAMACVGVVPQALAESPPNRWALAYQQHLADDVPLVDAPWVYTHNSFNSPAEMGVTVSAGLDPNQRLTITEQLDLGVRHLEIDEHLFVSPGDPRVGLQGPVVCHASGPAVGCTIEKPFVAVLGEIRRWLDRNPGEVLFLYFESHLDSVAGYRAGADSVAETLGDLVYRPPGGGATCDPLPLELTRDAMRAGGKRVIAMGPCGEGTAWPSYVFDESLRVTGSDNRPFRAFPDCGPDFTREEYGSKIIRYYEDSTQLTRATGGGATDPLTPALVRDMVGCGVDVIGLDQLVPDDRRLDALVWSWAPGRPSGAGECVVQRPDARWEDRSCAERHRVACRDAEGRWYVPPGAVAQPSAPRICRRPSLSTATPRTGFQNRLLRESARLAGGDDVWLGERRTGGRWARDERAGCGPALRSPRSVTVRRGRATIRPVLGFACTWEQLRRRLVVSCGSRPVRASAGHRATLRCAPAARRISVRFTYRGKRRSATAALVRR